MIEVVWTAKGPRSFDIDGVLARFPALRPEMVSYVGENDELDAGPDEAGMRGLVLKAGALAEALAGARAWTEKNRSALAALGAAGGQVEIHFHAPFLLFRELNAALLSCEDFFASIPIECRMAYPVPTAEEVREVFGDLADEGGPESAP